MAADPSLISERVNQESLSKGTHTRQILPTDTVLIMLFCNVSLICKSCSVLMTKGIKLFRKFVKNFGINNLIYLQKNYSHMTALNKYIIALTNLQINYLKMSKS